MKLLVALLLVAAAVSAATSFPYGTLQLVTVATPSGGDRYYIAYQPLSLQNSHGPVPVAVFFHDLGSSCLDVMTNDMYGLRTHSESQGVLLIAPCGVMGSSGLGWNTGACYGFDVNNTAAVDDIQFALDVHQSVAANANINRSMVGAFGYGNGAMLAQNLVCTAPETYTFSGTVAGLVTLGAGNLAGMAQCTTNMEAFAVRPRVVLLSGDQDGKPGWSGEAVCGFPTPVENFMQWGLRNRCNTDNVIEGWNRGQFESRHYAQCLSGASVELIRWWGGGHPWPTSSANGFSASEYLFSRFLQTV